MSEQPDNTPHDLDSLRKLIDQIDERLLQAIAERAKIVVAVGEAKRGDGTPIYAPDREKRVIEKALARNEGPLSDRTIEAIYREIMSGSFSLELPLRIGYLGPPGSFSHAASVRHFGSSVETVELPHIDSVFEEVASGRANYGLVPYENSIGGSVTDTLDAFREHDVTVYAEALKDVNQSLLSNCQASEIETIYSRQEAFAQCRRWLHDRFPNAQLIAKSSTSEAVKDAAAKPNTAAVGSPFAGELYGVKVLFERVSDKPNNITRFLILAREAAKPTGEDRTSIMFTTMHKPGALVDVLVDFQRAGINLTHIDKRPSGRENWDYTFFIDVEGHQNDAALIAAVEAAQEHCVELKVLGSYPRAQRIL